MTAVAFVWLGGLTEGSEPVVKSSSGNLDWRVQGWSDLVTAWSHSPTEWAIGQPIGQTELGGDVDDPRHPVAHRHLDQLKVGRRRLQGGGSLRHELLLSSVR